MMKKDERDNPASCWNKAKDGEMLFILLGRDIAAPTIIREWVGERIRLGKNNPGDAQVLEALRCASEMEIRQEKGDYYGSNEYLNSLDDHCETMRGEGDA